MIIPDGIDHKELDYLERTLFSEAKRSNKYILSAEQRPLYCLRLKTGSVLLTYGTVVDMKDAGNRSIDALQGIYVSREYEWHFRFSLPWLIKSHNELLDVYTNQLIQDADDFVRSRGSTMNYNMENTNFWPEGYISVGNNSIINDTTRTVNIPFSLMGYNQLMSLLLPLNTKNLCHIQFVFGCTRNEMTQLPSMNIVAEVSSYSDPRTLLEDNRDVQTTNKQITSSKISEMPQTGSGFDDQVMSLRPNSTTSSDRPAKNRRSRSFLGDFGSSLIDVIKNKK